MADQPTTVSKKRLVSQAGRLGPASMRKVDHLVKIQLGLLDASQ